MTDGSSIKNLSIATDHSKILDVKNLQDQIDEVVKIWKASKQ